MTYREPPKGWHQFGVHCDNPELVIKFSEELGEDGLPLWERVDVPPGAIDYHAIAAKLREQNPPPRENEPPREKQLISTFASMAAILALADALDAIGDDKS